MEYKIEPKEKWGKKKYEELANKFGYYHAGSEIAGSLTASYKNEYRINFDLFNNKLSQSDIRNYCALDHLDENGETQISHRDIISSRIKALLTQARKRPFPYKVYSINPEATTQREKEEFDQHEQYVISNILAPLRQTIEQENMAAEQGRDLNPQQIKELKAKVEQELKVRTPDEVKRYMLREYQDNFEMMNQQICNYITADYDIDFKENCNKAFFYGLCTGVECIYTGVIGEYFYNSAINPMFLEVGIRPTKKLEDLDTVSCTHYFTINQVTNFFKKDLKKDEIEDLYSRYLTFNRNEGSDIVHSMNLVSEETQWYGNRNEIPCQHTIVKFPTELTILHRIGEDGYETKEVVDASFEIDESLGHIRKEKKVFTVPHEVWKIDNKYVVNFGVVAGALSVVDEINNFKLPYVGELHDNNGFSRTCIVSRMKSLQYLYNVVNHRIELLIARDKGKNLVIDSSLAPDDIPFAEWISMLNNTDALPHDSSKEGSRQIDINNAVRVIDLSTGSDISKYIDLSIYIKKQAGEMVGLSDEMIGQFSPYETAKGVDASLSQTSNILEPTLKLHDNICRRSLANALEVFKEYARAFELKQLVYILDDSTKHILELKEELLDNRTVGVYVADTTKIEQIRQELARMAHAAMQNGAIEMSQTIEILLQDDLTQAKETLLLAEQKRRDREDQQQERQIQADKESKQMEMEHQQMLFEMELQKISHEQAEKRETELQKAALMAASFNPDVDRDGDGINDFVEIMMDGENAKIKGKELTLKEKEMMMKNEIEKRKLDIEEKKLSVKK